MRIMRVQPSPPPEYMMTFSQGEGWAVVAALREYADAHPNAVDVEKWRGWAKELDTSLRGCRP